MLLLDLTDVAGEEYDNGKYHEEQYGHDGEGRPSIRGIFLLNSDCFLHVLL